MTRDSALTLVLLGGSLMGGLGGSACRSRRAPLEVDVSRSGPVASASVAVPVDHVLPGELAEGTEVAFGLPLPRAMTVRGRFTDSVIGDIEMPRDRVSNFIRERVTADRVVTGPGKTLFPRVTVRGKPDIELSIQVLSHGGSTEIRVENLSLVKMTPGLTEEERWRAVGLKPDGTLIDPTHLQ